MQRYKGLGLKLTPQRLSILAYLEDNKCHPTADGIYRHVSKKFPTMSPATVYNTLEALKKRGMLTEITIDSDKKHFDPDTSRHHHAICTSCKKIVDIHTDFDLSTAEKELCGFKITGSHVEFYGLCRDCSIKGAAKKKSAIESCQT
jgi:Fur family transcriptional regulator, peroxide stress response regulator